MRLVLIYLLLAGGAMAANVERSHADRCAAAALENLTEHRTLDLDHTVDLHHGWLYALEPQGYLVISGDTRLPPVLAWSLTAPVLEWPQGSNLLLELLDADLNSRMQHIEMLSDAELCSRTARWERLSSGLRYDGSRIQYWPPQDSTTTGGWVETQWGQGAPYNQMVPTNSSGQRSLAGCPSVVMAQILSLHRSTRDTRFDAGDRYHHNYAGSNYWIDDDAEDFGFPSFPELNTCLDTLDARWADGIAIQNEDIAALIFACGVAARQVYHPQGSGTFGVSQAFSAWQRFNYGDCRLLDDDVEDTWNALIENMMDGHPAHLAVVTPQWDSGHNVVVDGYNSDGYFHINFGWTGSYDGWYLLPQELPYNLSVLEGLIVDLFPLSVAIPPVQPLGMELQLACYPNPANPGLSVEVQAAQTSQLEVLVFNLLGQEVATLYKGAWSGVSRTLQWNPTGAGGCYLVQARSADGTSRCARVTVIP